MAADTRIARFTHRDLEVPAQEPGPRGNSRGLLCLAAHDQSRHLGNYPVAVRSFPFGLTGRPEPCRVQAVRRMAAPIPACRRAATASCTAGKVRSGGVTPWPAQVSDANASELWSSSVSICFAGRREADHQAAHREPRKPRYPVTAAHRATRHAPSAGHDFAASPGYRGHPDNQRRPGRRLPALSCTSILAASHGEWLTLRESLVLSCARTAAVRPRGA